MPITSRAQAHALDAKDPLALLRGRFRVPDGITYLVGHSLGPVSEPALTRLKAHAEGAWAKDMVGAWNSAGWIDLAGRVGDRLAGLIGAEPGSVTVCDSVSVNLFKLVAAALPLAEGAPVIRIESDEFPTDRYIAEGLARTLGVPCEILPPGASDAALIKGGVLIRSAVNYRTSEIADIARTENAARAGGALVIWDLSHATGLIALELGQKGALLATGCTYKYVNGGPGAPAFLYVASGLCDRLQTPIPGWLGHKRPFDFDPAYEAADGVGRFVAGTPPILSLAALDGALDIFEGLDFSHLHEKAQILGDICIRQAENLGLRTLSPGPGKARGGHVSLQHDHGYEIVQALKERGRQADFRAPDTLRFGFSPLILSYTDVWDTMVDLADIMATQLWTAPRFALRAKVT